MDVRRLMAVVTEPESMDTFHAVKVEKSQRSVYQLTHRVAGPNEGVKRFCWALDAAQVDGRHNRTRDLLR